METLPNESKEWNGYDAGDQWPQSGMPGKIIGSTAKDPWAHRSDGMKCRTCMWFAEKKARATITVVGRCRRHAPTMSGYPVVFADDWCGDHKLDENKV